MALFQNSVLNKYLKGLDQSTIDAVFQKYTAYFLNSDIQDNIRSSKEEQFQATFLNELFVNILGYTLNPNPNFNLTTEFKNIKNSKKADGAILKDNKAIAVIELKGTNTTDLDKIESQAFGYKNNQPTAVYVITSNFEKLRFYIDDAVDYLDFNLFTLTENQFKLLYLCLHKDHIYSNLPHKIKSDSTLQEENITKKLYKDYSTFKKALFNDLLKNNPEQPKLVLFKKSQKLLDRFLFVFFAEDKGLLPPNSVSQIVENYHDLIKLDFYHSLYDVFNRYFSYIDKGRPQRGDKPSIFAFNGGLFAPDVLLDNLIISDEVLLKHTVVLSTYDFASEVDVNILGHIFEHSLNEIDEMTAEIEGQAIDKSKTKRKKDGVFYTPKYITKYIVENTVGKLCAEKKTELNIIEEDYAKDRKGRKKATLKKLNTQLERYREWLLALTICDPACGSGAFLNQALDFLIEEHRYIDELQTKLLGGGFVFPNVENSILENNLYGVDINEESVEIAKLSLWLRTVKKGRQLTSLNNNIKCANSLIDEVEVAGDKAFNWEEEFPKVFIPKNKQAFHVVFTTHNSRTSQRMMKLGIEKGDPVELSSKEELELTKIIRNVMVEYQYRCLSYNICKDHVHLILVCELEELSGIVQNIKSNSGRRFNVWKGITTPYHLSETREQAPLERKSVIEANSKATDSTSLIQSEGLSTPRELAPLSQERGKTQNHLWSQKFFRADLDVWEWGHVSTKPGYVYQDTHLTNALSYIDTNRQKHELLEIPELKAIIEEMTCSQETAFALEYKGGFDVVVGNPPYVRQELFKPFKPYFQKTFQTYQGTADLFTYFIELSVDKLLNPNGLYSIIVANKWMRANYGKPLRQWMKQKQIIEIIDFGDLPVFKDATAYPCILTLSPKTPEPNFWVTEPDNLNFPDLELYVKSHQFRVKADSLKESGWSLVNEKVSDLLDKLDSKGIPLKQYVESKIFYGIKTGLNEAFVIDEATKNKLIEEDPKSTAIIKPFLAGRDIQRYTKPISKNYLLFVGWNTEINDFQAVKSYLTKFKDKLDKRPEVKTGRHPWYSLSRYASDYHLEFEKAKIIYAEIASRGQYYYDKDGYYGDTTSFILGVDSLPLVGVLNSRIWTFLVKNVSSSIRGGFIRWKKQYLENLPIPTNLLLLEPFVIEQHCNYLNFTNAIRKFSHFLKRKFNLEKLSRNLQNWHTITFNTFLKELKKKKINLSLSEEGEWEDYFEAEKAKVQKIKAVIAKTDQEIDNMVYGLYGLTEEEIVIVENS